MYKRRATESATHDLETFCVHIDVYRCFGIGFCSMLWGTEASERERETEMKCGYVSMLMCQLINFALSAFSMKRAHFVNRHVAWHLILSN